jgi:hypothetical protein
MSQKSERQLNHITKAIDIAIFGKKTS